MNQTEKEKLLRFMNDESMSNAVHSLLLKSFLEPHPWENVNLLAASRIAIDLLEDAWKDLARFKTQEEAKRKEVTQVGL